MNVVDCLDCLELQHEQLLDEDIGNVLSHDDTVVANGDAVLLIGPQAGLAELVR
jgi:hypothetical protein